jgi:hypothetical protein
MGFTGSGVAVALAQGYVPFADVALGDCHDGDICTVTVPNLHPFIGKEIPVRIRGIDAPELRGQCSAERDKARLARDFLRALLMEARTIELRNVERDSFFRLLADVYADGADVSAVLLKEGYAVPYDGKHKRPDWCGSAQGTVFRPLLLGVGGGILFLGVSVGSGLVAFRLYQRRRRGRLLQEIVGRLQAIDGIVKRGAAVHVEHEWLEEQDLPGLNQVFVEVGAQVMAAAEEGKTSITVSIPSVELAQAAAELFNKTDVQARVVQNGAVLPRLTWAL